MIWNSAEPYSMAVNYPASWDYNMVSGGHAAVVELDEDSYEGLQTCENFNEPVTTSKNYIDKNCFNQSKQYIRVY